MPDTATDQTAATPTDDGDCPLGTRWVSWTLARLVNRGHVSPEECEAVLRARQETGWRALRPLSVIWAVGPGDAARTPDAPGLLVDRRHAHTTFTIAGQSVHVDWTTGTSWGPLSSYTMARIYVGGALRNETVQGGSSLGYTVYSSTILAVLDPVTAISLGPVRYSETSPPTVWLMENDAAPMTQTGGHGTDRAAASDRTEVPVRGPRKRRTGRPRTRPGLKRSDDTSSSKEG